MLSIQKLITALDENGVIHVGLEPPKDMNSGWWLQVNPDNLEDARNTGALSRWEA